IDLSASLDRGLAPDSLSPKAIAVLAAWIGLVTVLYVSLPPWIGSWADAWQQPAAGASPRRPARVGLLATSAAVCVVLAVDLWWLFRYAPYVEQFDADSRRTLSQWTLQGHYLPMQRSLQIV